jgi:hypothetical protein
MIAGLVSYHDWVGVEIVEDTLEHVRIGNYFFPKLISMLCYSFRKIELKKLYSRSGNERCQIQSTTTGCGKIYGRVIQLSPH